MGESGSGKTTLLNLLAALDRPTEGKILLAGKDITQIGDSNISRFRRENLGFVFQDFNLLDNFSLRDNIYLPLVLSNTPKKQMEKQIEPLAAQLKISDILKSTHTKYRAVKNRGQPYCPCIDYCSKTCTCGRTYRGVGLPFFRTGYEDVYGYTQNRADNPCSNT